MSEKFRLDRKIGFQNTFYTKYINVIIDSIGPSIILRSISKKHPLATEIIYFPPKTRKFITLTNCSSSFSPSILVTVSGMLETFFITYQQEQNSEFKPYFTKECAKHAQGSSISIQLPSVSVCPGCNPGMQLTTKCLFLFFLEK